MQISEKRYQKIKAFSALSKEEQLRILQKKKHRLQVIRRIGQGFTALIFAAWIFLFYLCFTNWWSAKVYLAIFVVGLLLLAICMDVFVTDLPGRHNKSHKFGPSLMSNLIDLVDRQMQDVQKTTR